MAGHPPDGSTPTSPNATPWENAYGRRVAELLHDGRPVLLGGVADAAHGWADWVDTVHATIADGPNWRC
jgi:hypothetical protein